MSAAIPLRDDFNGSALRALAKASKDANQTRRLLCLAVIYEGGLRSEAAVLGGVGLQIIRDWVLRFNAEGPEGLLDRKPPGASSKLNDAQRRALCEIVESGPIPAIDGVVRWRLKDLAQWLWDEFGVSLDESTVSRELKVLGFSKVSARPRHRAQNEFVREDFKKPSPPRWQRSGRGCRPAPR
jgi:putative transposase